MNDVDAAYIAGLFDGEGSVYYNLPKENVMIDLENLYITLG